MLAHYYQRCSSSDDKDRHALGNVNPCCIPENCCRHGYCYYGYITGI